MTVVRAAQASDWLAAARIHVAGWQHTYRGAMSDEFLDGLVPEEWSKWRKDIYSNPPDHVRLLVATVDDSVVGYVDVGRSRSGDEEITGELYGIYVEPDHIGHGHGRALIKAAREALVELGHDRVELWVLSNNDRARRFYEIDGWVADGAEKTEALGGGVVHEVRYVRDLESPDHD